VLCLLAAIWAYQHKAAEVEAMKSDLDRTQVENAKYVANLRMELADSKRAQGGTTQPVSSVAKVTPKPAVEDQFKLARQDPLFAARLHKRQLRDVQRRFGDTIAAMKLPADQARKLRELLVSRANAQTDTRDVSRESGLSPEETKYAVAQAADEVNNEIKALIGDDNFAALQQPPIGILKPIIENSIGLDLAMSGTPLTPAQTTMLAQSFSPILRPGPMPGGANQKADPVSGLTPYYQTLLDSVSPNLTPDQLPAVKAFLVDQVQQRLSFNRAPPIAVNKP
jgi:hypothetical protein